MADFREVRCSTDGERGGNETQSAAHLLSIPRRRDPTPGEWRGYKPRPNLMALYDDGGRLKILFDSDRAYDLIVPEAPDDQPITEADIAAARLEDFDNNEAGHVYFIGGDIGAIKIGRSVNVEVRLKDIQACSPIPVRILATRKGVSRERLYHALFAAHRLHGEWFERHPDILAEIELLNALGASNGPLSPCPLIRRLERNG